MLTRSLYLAAGWFAISLIAMLIGGTRLKRANLLLSVVGLAGVLALGDLWAILTFGVPEEIALLTVFAFAFGLFWALFLRDWNVLGQTTWTFTLLSTILFIVYAFQVTAFSPLNPISFVISLIFFFIEMLALLLALTHTYESLEAMTRVRWHRRVTRIDPIPGYAPKVSLQVPTYNEPVDVVEGTLRSLAQMDYPNYEVLVIDNNTPAEENWRALEQLCKQLGPKFSFLHLDQWPGYKSGALNFALTACAPDTELIGSIDADYRLDPAFLKTLVPVFADPKVAFIQTPQDYRDYEGDPFTESTYHGYKYFFEVSMPVRNEHNAIIFAGTMGLLRKSVLQEIGGWDEWCITEDAEASLRILKKGYESIYYKRSFGRGLMPFTFDGLKKQRFRWCFGGIQILKKHWGALMPWAGWVDANNHLTLAQRYFYLMGGLQWFTDLFNVFFAFFLVLGGLFNLFASRFAIRPVTPTLLVLPAVFLVLNLLRFLWVLRTKLDLSWRVAFRSMYNFFSMGWVVTLASLQGLIQKEGVFLRTPKAKEGSKVWHAISVTRWETIIGLVCLVVALAVMLLRPGPATLSLGLLLLWESSLYLSAPYYSLLSIREKPDLRAAETGHPVAENWAARWAIGLVALLFVIGVAAQFVPQPTQPPSYAQYQPEVVPVERLVGLEQVPIDERRYTVTPTLTPTPTEPVDTPQPTSTAAAVEPTGTPADAPTSTAQPDAATGTPAPAATSTEVPVATDTPAPAATSTQAPVATDTAAPLATSTAAAPATSTVGAPTPAPTNPLPTPAPTNPPATAVPATDAAPTDAPPTDQPEPTSPPDTSQPPGGTPSAP